MLPSGDEQCPPERCGVCLDTVEARGVLDCCEHVFCAACILSWAEKENKCPVCRARFTTVTRPGDAPVSIPRTNQVYEWDGTLFEDESDALDDVRCDICGEGDREDELLLCRRFEVCGASAHASCLGLPAVPDDDWECYRCAATTRRRERVTAARVSALASPAATGATPEEQARLSGENFSVSGDVLDLECPPSPGDDEATVRNWVVRQRTIASNLTAVPSRDDGASRAALQRSSLRTIRQFRDNWEALRDGRLSFDVVSGQRHPQMAATTGTRPRARTRHAPTVIAPTITDCEADPSQLSWHALEELRRHEQRVAERRQSSASRRAPARRVEQQGPADGFLQHLAGMRRMRGADSSEEFGRPRTARRVEQPAVAPDLHHGGGSGQPRVGTPRSFVIPRKS